MSLWTFTWPNKTRLATRKWFKFWINTKFRSLLALEIDWHTYGPVRPLVTTGQGETLAKQMTQTRLWPRSDKTQLKLYLGKINIQNYSVEQISVVLNFQILFCMLNDSAPFSVAISVLSVWLSVRIYNDFEVRQFINSLIHLYSAHER